MAKRPKASSDTDVKILQLPPNLVKATAIFADEPPKCVTKLVAFSVLVPGGSGYISIPVGEWWRLGTY